MSELPGSRDEPRTETSMGWGAILLTAAIGALAQLGTAYPGFAATMQWRCASWVGSDGTRLYHGLAGLGLLYVAWSLGGVLGVLVAIPLSLAGAFVLAMTVRWISPYLALLSLPLAVLWYVLAMGESCVGSDCTRLLDTLLASAR